MERKGTKRTNSAEKSPSKRQKKNQRPGDEANGTSAVAAKRSEDLENQIKTKIQEYFDTEKDPAEARKKVLVYQNKCLRHTATIGEVKLFEDLLLVKDIDVNTMNKESQTPLILASQAGHIEIVRKLLDPQLWTKVEAIDVHGYSALLHSATKNHLEVLRLLMEKTTNNINHKSQIQCSALVLAANAGHADIVKELLAQKDIDVNSSDDGGDSPLIHASEEGYVKVVELLLAHPKLQVNYTNSNGDISLMCASNRGHAAIVEKLLKVKNIEVNVKNNDGYTALMCAADKGNGNVMDLLLAHKAINVNIVDENNDSALNWAVDKEHKEIVRKIIGHGKVEKNKRNVKAVKAHLMQGKQNTKEAAFESPFITAITDGEAEIVKWLLEHGDIQINRRERATTPLIEAVKGSSKAVFDIIMSQPGLDVNATDVNKYTALAWAAAWAFKSDITFLATLSGHKKINLDQQDEEGYTALGRAAELGCWEAVVHLTSLSGIDVNRCGGDGMTPLLCAAGSGHRGVVQSILKCDGVDVNCSSALTGYTPLIWAADRGHAEVVEELLKHRETDVNRPDKNGYSALIWAADLNQPEIVEILMHRKDIEVNAMDVDGHTALIWASDKGNITVVNHLLKHKDLDPNIQDHDGLSALICAATMGQVEMVKRLLQCNRVEVNLQDNDERHTALIAAVNKNFVKVVDALMQHQKLDMNTRDRHGMTAYKLAKDRNYTAILKLFSKQKLILQHPKVAVPVRKDQVQATSPGASAVGGRDKRGWKKQFGSSRSVKRCAEETSGSSS